MNFKHGGRSRSHKTPEYSVWVDMRRRCEDPRDIKFKDYGGRGITVHKRWQKFENFLADMGRRPGLEYSIDRKINDFPYSPLNCRWATITQQNRNRRYVKLSPGKADGIRFLFLFGVPQRALARKFGVTPALISRVVTKDIWKRDHVPAQ